MSGETLHEAPRKYNAAPIRVHDYIYDSAYIVSGARDYARTAFKAAMASAQLVIQPVYKTMFSELRKFPRMQVVYHPNCRLPQHVDRSYGAYVARVVRSSELPDPQLGGRDRFKFCAIPKKVVLNLKSATPDFHPPSPRPPPADPTRPRNRGTQSLFRESSAQTVPWQPDGKAAEVCEETPEVLYLDKLEWGPGHPYRTGDLPADFHTTEIINKMRHARVWNEVAEKGQFPRWMKRRDAIITDVETKDWIFREAEIDELQDIRLELLHRMQSRQRDRQTGRTSQKLAKRWASKKQEMERKIDKIRRGRDRELRKLSAYHGGGGRLGLVQRVRAARGGGSATAAAHDPASDVHAPLARHGYQARGRHAEITYDPSLLMYEDHEELSEPPAWLEQCGQNLKKTCSGHHLPRDPMKLCERETKWSDQFLESLHNDLKKARMGAASSAGPLHVLKPRRLVGTPRPATAEVESVSDMDESNHQAALLLQRIIRGRAVQCLMYEGRTRAAELTEELKTTHGLQEEDKVRIAKEEAKAREYNVLRTEAEQKEDAITALVDELCGGAVSAALDFLEKELRRLKEERRQHAFILVALREKSMREAAEAGRRQKEEHRRREHDEMFKQILGVTQETVDAYLHHVIQEGVELGAEGHATRRAELEADRVEVEMAQNESMSTAEQLEVVAELVHQFLLPEAHRSAARAHIAALQRAKLDAARDTIFGVLDDAEIKKPVCTRCGVPLGELCRCRECHSERQPVETTSRDDPRWKLIKKSAKKELTHEERYPPYHEFRCMLNALVDDVMVEARREKDEKYWVKRHYTVVLRQELEKQLEARELVNLVVDFATGAVSKPVMKTDYKYYMRRVVEGALDRTEPPVTCPCPKELPSEVRRKAEEKAAAEDDACRCVELEVKGRVQFTLDSMDPAERKKLLPSELRALEELRRCKCDSSQSPEGEEMSESDPFALDPLSSITEEESLQEEKREDMEED